MDIKYIQLIVFLLLMDVVVAAPSLTLINEEYSLVISTIDENYSLVISTVDSVPTTITFLNDVYADLQKPKEVYIWQINVTTTKQGYWIENKDKIKPLNIQDIFNTQQQYIAQLKPIKPIDILPVEEII